MTSGLLLAWLMLLPSATWGNNAVVTIAEVPRAGVTSTGVKIGTQRFHANDVSVSFRGSHIQGVALSALAVGSGDDRWSVAAPLVYALPNRGSPDGLMNARDVRGAVLLFDRGPDLSVVEQARAAEHAGAVAAIVVDLPGANERETVLRARVQADREGVRWKSPIPAVVVSHKHRGRLIRGMDLVRGDVHDHEDQYVMAGSVFAEWILHGRDSPNDEL